MKDRNRFGTSGDPSWHPTKQQGVRIRNANGNFELTPGGDEAIRGAKPLPDLDASRRTEHFAGGRVVKTNRPNQGAFVPPAAPPKTLDRGYSPLPNWTPKGPGTRLDTGRASDGQRFPRERRPDRGK